MTHHAKAPSAGSTQATGVSRGLLRRASATRGASHGSKGSGAPAAKLLGLFAISLIALFASAAPASAASAEMGTVSNVSYTSAHATGKTTTSGLGGDFQPGAAYRFEYSTDGTNWNTGFSGTYVGKVTDKKVEGNISGLKGGTQYSVRLSVSSFGDPPVPAISSEPYPSFTTLAVDPPSVVTIDNASEVSYTTATVKGKVARPANADPAFNVDCHFQYVTDEQFQATGFTDNPGDIPCEGTNPIETPGNNDVQAHLTGLANDTTYHLRLVVSNASPPTDAEEAAQTFTTLAVTPPSVISTDNATAVEYSQAQVKGVVERPNTSEDPAFDTFCFFEYVTDQQFNENPPGEEFAGAGQFACETEPPENPITATGQTPVKAQLTGLAPSTEYHLRLNVSNLGGQDTEEAPATFTTQGPVPLPSVIAIDAPSELAYNSAKFTGTLQRPAGADPALNVNCRFEYITDAQFLANEAATEPGFAGAQTAECAENPITSEGETPVSAKPALVANTTYHLRLVAENLVGGSDAKVAAATFTTPEADKPTLTIDPIGDVFTKAHVTGTATFDNGHKGAGFPFLQISSDGGATWDIAGQMKWKATTGPLTEGEFKDKYFEIDMAVEEEGLYLLKQDITGLQPSTTYLVRIALSYRAFYSPDLPEAEANGEVGFSPVETITTEPLQSPPTAEDFQITDIAANSAHFSVTVDPHAPAGPLSEAAKKAYATHWEFVCVPECKNANGNPIEGTVQGEEGAKSISGDAKRLDPNTPYEVSLLISSEGGGETLGPVPFNTPLVKPTLKAAPGGSDGKGGYILQATVNPNKSPVSACKFAYGPNSGLELNDYAFQADCSPPPGGGAKPVTVEAPLTALNPGATYHFRLFATNGAGTEKTEDQIFVPAPAVKDNCANEQQRAENSSLALPECRAYEQVTPAGKEGSRASIFKGYGGIGDAVSYQSEAGNIAKSGQNAILLDNYYVTTRTATGWETIPNLNGSSGSFRDAPSYVDIDNLKGSRPAAYSPDLLSSVWTSHRKGDPGFDNYYLRSPDGTFTLIGRGDLTTPVLLPLPAVSADLSHLVVSPVVNANGSLTLWGPGVYEFVGTGVDVPRRVDVDNSGDPLTTCFDKEVSAAKAHTISPDGREIVFTVPGDCKLKDPGQQIWARVNGTTSFEVSASQCTRPDCNAPAPAIYAGAAKDGSRVFFTTTQQLVNSDTDQTYDIYACDIPAGSPGPIGDTANPCTSLIEMSGAATEAKVEPPLYDQFDRFLGNPGLKSVSRDGATVSFVAEGVLADNKDAFGEKAVAGDHNLYVWRTDAAHPTGQTLFVGRLDSSDVQGAQFTPDGRYLVFTTASQLVLTDTDGARDVYRYDTDTGELIRASTNVFGVAGNGQGFDVRIPPESALSDDGQKIVFTTTEALSTAVDGNKEPDAYLWTPERVSLISSGSVGGGAVVSAGSGVDAVWINGSGRDIYFQTPGALTPGDGDDLEDVYDARIGGGFSFASTAPCSGGAGACQSHSPKPAPAPAPASTQPPIDPGNVKPRSCPKGKVLKGSKCVKKKKHKKHSGKKHHGKKAAHKQGGGK